MAVVKRPERCEAVTPAAHGCRAMAAIELARCDCPACSCVPPPVILSAKEQEGREWTETDRQTDRDRQRERKRKRKRGENRQTETDKKKWRERELGKK